jgi:hypothetical protein
MLNNLVRASLFSRICLLCVCSLLCGIPLVGQSFYGSIVGTVTDSSGSTLPGANVTVNDPASGFRRTIVTGDDGSYNFVNLVPGTYTLEVEKTGFKKNVRTGITLEVQATIRMDIAMQVGAVDQTIQVSGATPLMQTETSSLGQVIGAQTVDDLPLNGRNVLNLISLVPGVVTQGGASGNLTTQNIFASGNYQINGGTANQNAMYLDGSPIQVTYGSLTALIPTQDAIAEFRVQTNGNDAEYGRYSGGVVNLTTRSGSNQFHGTAYEFLRNKVLNANNWFNNDTGTPRSAFTQNQYGVSLGGPIIKDKLFFFFNYEGFALRQGETFVEPVPTLAELSGDFSNYRDANGNVIPIYDPLTSSSTCSAQPNTPCRTQFPGNIIPTNRIDPVAQYFAANGRIFPTPNTTSLPYPFNFVTSASVGGNNDQINFRSDWNVSSKQRVFARYTRWAFDELPWDPYNNDTYWFDLDPQNFVTDSIVVGDTYTFDPSTILDVRVSYLRFNYFQGPPSSITGFDMTTFGFPAYMNQIPAQFRTFPAFAFPDYPTGGTQVISSVNNNYVISPSLTKILGRQTLKFGAELRRQDANYYQIASQAGDYFFDNTFTSANPFNPGTTGGSIADFLLGGASPGGGFTPSAILTENITASSMRYQGYYVQDDIRVNNKLTINAGLRWEIPGVWTERHNRLSNFDPDMTNILAAPTGLPLKGGFVLVNTPGHPDRGLYAEHFDLFSPRIGFAYQMNNSTVIRAAYGWFYVPSDAIFQESPFQNAVNIYNNAMITSENGGVTPSSVLSNPYPGGLSFPPGRNANFQSALLGLNFSAVSGAGGSAPVVWHPGYYQNWNLTVQHQFPLGINLEASYVGSHGVHLPINSDNGVNINQLPDADLSLGNQLLQEVPNPFAGLITSGPLSAPTVQYGQLLRPFPTYQNVVESAAYIGSSNYNALQMKLQKRFSHGGTILGSYTFSKLMTNTETSTDWLETGIAGALGQIYQDFNNMAGERSLGLFDTRQSLTISYVYPLPVGKGQHFMGDVQGVADKFVSGWEFDGITTFQEGFPLNLVAIPNLTNSFGGGLRPNVTPGCNKTSVSNAGPHNINEYFNTSCFSAPPEFAFGDESRTDGAIRAPGINNWDIALVKNTSITERFNLQFRTEFFNAFNRTQFGPPGQVFTSGANSTFGIISSQQNNPRLIQFGLRLNY